MADLLSECMAFEAALMQYAKVFKEEVEKRQPSDELPDAVNTYNQHFLMGMSLANAMLLQAMRENNPDKELQWRGKKSPTKKRGKKKK